MKYQIVYDKPQRIRFRCGGYAFEKSLEGAMYEHIKKLSFVDDVLIHAENGGLLILYKVGCRDKVIEFVKAFDPRNLTPIELSNDNSISQIDSTFKNDIIAMVAKRYISKAILPQPILNFITLVRSVKYIAKGFKALLDGKLNVEVLDSASISASLLQKDYNTASTVMFLISISSRLEDYTKARTKAVLKDSLAIHVDKVWLVQSDKDVLIPMSELKVGDNIRVRTGSIIPVDGEVTDGEANVNESSMTGEPLAVMKSKGTTVFAGTTIEEGSLVIKVRAFDEGTKIQKIVELIDTSESLKASIQSKAETLADGIVPYSFLAFGLTLAFTQNITRAVSLLMVDYSCAIKLSTPIAVISAIREASDHDITVKGGKYLEEFAQADCIVFDKTGTLTNANPVLEKVITLGEYSEEDVLKISACIEEHFPHSVARAIVKGALDRGLQHLEEHADVKYIVAHGIATTLYGKRAVIGSKHFILEDENVEITDEQQSIIDEQSGACSVVYLAIGGKLEGALCISDPPRLEAKETIKQLRKLGIDKVVMLTGDSQRTAESIAKSLGISTYYAQVLPEDKHKYIEEVKAQGYSVIMVGDGINDAPALAVANVSVAMSDASDIAKETADITLRTSNLNELVLLRKLSTALMDKVSANYRFIIGFNSALLVLGFAGAITPSTSALLHNLSTMGICVKSMQPLLGNSKD